MVRHRNSVWVRLSRWTITSVWSVGMGLRTIGLVLGFGLFATLINSVSLAAQYGSEGHTVPLRVPVCRPSATRSEASFSQVPRGVHPGAVQGNVHPLYNSPPAVPRPSRRASDSRSAGPLSALYSLVSYPIRMLSGADSRQSRYEPPVSPPPVCVPMKPPSGGPEYMPSAAKRWPDGLHKSAYGYSPRHH